MEIEEVEVSMAEVLLSADRENLTAYDASYLWLSRKLGLELVTLDGDLKAAAAAAASRELPL
jgi:predicted nucleic acid-binding protein